MLAPLLVAAVILATPAVVAADPIYRWVDANGNVSFSSTPPPGAAAQPVELPPSPTPAQVEAARERERSIQELGTQLSQQRADREAQLAEERQAARAEAAQAPVQPIQDSSITPDDGWWIPAYPPVHRPIRPRPPPGRPVPPPPGRDPTAPPDHPAFWPREPWLPPDVRPIPRPLPAPLPAR
jgi:hypothetical protein